jgi:PAS domain S-box-containing protein
MQPARSVGGGFRRLRALLDALHDGVVVADADGRIDYLNRAAFRMFGYESEAILGQSIELLLGEDDYQAFMSFMEDSRERGAEGDLSWREFSICDSRGRHFRVEANLSTLPDGDDHHFVCVFREISGLIEYRNRLEAEVARHTRDLRRSLRREFELRMDLSVSLNREKELNELRRNFVSVVSHEFRTPLAVIQSSADLLSEYYERMSPEQRGQRLDKIRREVLHMTEMMDDVVFFERSRQLRFPSIPLRLTDLAEEAVDDTLTVLDCERAIQIDLLRPADEILDLPEILIRRILGNLLRNAVRYSPEGTPVSVVLDGDGDRLEMRVRNSGSIPIEIRESLFEPFVRGSGQGNYSGSGLGLAIVSRAVELCGGEYELVDPGPESVEISVRMPLPVERGAD